MTLALADDIDAIAEQGQAAAGRLADAPAQQQHALHLDHRVPGAQGQPQGHQGLGRPRQAGRRRSSRPTRRPRAARAGTTSPPGPMRSQARRRRGQGAGLRRQALQATCRCSTPARAARPPPSSSAASATCCSPGRTRPSWRSRSSGKDKFEIVVPSISILAEPPVAVVDTTSTRKGTRKRGRGLSRIPLHARTARRSRPSNFYRPRKPEVGRSGTTSRAFPSSSCSRSTSAFGGWTKAQAKHFADGGVFDQIYTAGDQLDPRSRCTLAASLAPPRASSRASSPGFGLALGFTLPISA